MSDFVAFSEEIEDGMDILEHHGILNQRWGHRNGPPYPLGAGDHSAGEKRAAKAAGIKVGSSSGRGSISKIKRFGARSKSEGSEPEKPGKTANSSTSTKKELTPEEKREKALQAARSGDAKKIAKNMDQLSTEELRDATDRARYKNQLADEDNRKQKLSKAEMEKQEAIRSGDKEKVKQYADKMSYAELSEAMNKVALTEKLNHVDPPPTIADKIDNAMNKIDQARGWAEKGISAYNTMAKVYNSTHKGEAQWPEIHPKNNNNEKDKTKEAAEGLLKQVSKDVSQGVKETQEQKSYKQQSKEKLENRKEDYKRQKEYEEWVAKQEKGKKTTEELNEKMEQKAKEEAQSNPSPQPQPKAETSTPKQETPAQEEKQYKYTPERAPEATNARFNFSKPKQEEKTNTEPTEEQKRILEQEREKDRRYMEQMNNASKQKVNSYDDNDLSYDEIMNDYKDAMRTSMNNATKQANAYSTDYEEIYDWFDRF